MATKRKTLSKKTRFEVFKRDAFACQYCGAHPPTAILHADHINPVANGGDNSMDNLITSCESCNQGKAANLLSDIPISLQQKAAEIIEREAQIKGYTEAMNGKRFRIEVEATEVQEVYENFNRGFTLNEKSMVTVRHFIGKLGVHEVVDAMERAFSRSRNGNDGGFKYFCGICWKKIKEAEGV